MTNSSSGEGFRNLFGHACPNELYQGAGSEQATSRLMLRLAEYMKNQRRDRSGNATFPAGYTYLAQFAAHDLVHNPTRIPNLADHMRPRHDLRDQRLMLETLYGGGPGACPAIFRRESNSGQVRRSALRLLYVPDDKNCQRPSMKPEGHACPGAFRDLPRLIVDDGPGEEERTTYGDVLLADPRNDDHLIIAQLTVVFTLLHNLFDDLQRRNHPDRSARQRYLRASKATIFLYRRILFEDLLPKLLHPMISTVFEQCGFRLERDPDPRMTVEFAHAVFRAAHSMVRQSYDLNERLNAGIRRIVDQRSSTAPTRLPHRDKWLIAWSRFFDIDGRAPAQKARNISPTITDALYDNVLFRDDDQPTGGLLYADLRRGAFSGVRSVDSLIEKLIAANLPGAESLQRAHWEPALHRWLSNGMTSDDTSALTRDPPLILFVMQEATVAPHRSAFGLLGSAVVAETFYAARDKTRSFIEDDDETQRLVMEVFDTGPDALGIPNTMPSLITALAKKLGYTELTMPFI